MRKSALTFGRLTLLASILLISSTAAFADALSPKDTYLKYRAALANAKEVKEISTFLCKKANRQINETPENDKAMMFEMMKEMTPNEVQVVSEETKDEHATLKLTGNEPRPADKSIKEKIEGTVTFIKENGEWKIDKESWNSSITKTD